MENSLEQIDLRRVKNISGICYSGRSGSYLLSNLFDSHSSVLSCPPHSLHNSPFTIIEILKHVQANNISDSKSIISLIVKTHGYIFDGAEHASMLGEPYKKHPVGVDEDKFATFALKILNCHIQKYKNLCPQDLFVLIHWAYESCKDNPITEKFPSIVWQRHIPLNQEQCAILENEFSNLFLITCIRRLENSFDSHLVHHIEEKPFGSPQDIFFTLIEQFCLSISKKTIKHPQYAVKFEDLHLNTEHTMRKLCNLLDIKFENILCETTLDGSPFHFYKNGNTITGTNKNLSTEVKTKMLTSADIYFMQIYFKKFFEAYSYDTAASFIAPNISNKRLTQILGSFIANARPLDLI